jgi:hypothetical protein
MFAHRSNSAVALGRQGQAFGTSRSISVAEEGEERFRRASYEQARQQEEVRMRTANQRLIVDAQGLDSIVTRFAVTADPDLRSELLVRGLSISIDGLDLVIEDRLVQDFFGYLAERHKPPAWDIDVGLEALRDDAASLKAFLSAQSRALIDTGLSADTTARIRSALAYVMIETHTTPRADLSELISGLRDDLLQDGQRLQAFKGQRRVWHRLTRVLEAFGGMIIASGHSDQRLTVSPVHHSLSIYGHILSEVVGIVVVEERITRAIFEKPWEAEL